MVSTTVVSVLPLGISAGRPLGRELPVCVIDSVTGGRLEVTNNVTGNSDSRELGVLNMGEVIVMNSLPSGPNESVARDRSTTSENYAQVCDHSRQPLLVTSGSTKIDAITLTVPFAHGKSA